MAQASCDDHWLALKRLEKSLLWISSPGCLISSTSVQFLPPMVLLQRPWRGVSKGLERWIKCNWPHFGVKILVLLASGFDPSAASELFHLLFSLLGRPRQPVLAWFWKHLNLFEISMYTEMATWLACATKSGVCAFSSIAHLNRRFLAQNLRLLATVP